MYPILDTRVELQISYYGCVKISQESLLRRKKAGILAQRILRKHSRKECDKNRGARRTSDEERQSRRAADDAEISPLAGRRQ